MVFPLEFENKIAELESKISGLRKASDNSDINFDKEIKKLEEKLKKAIHRKYNNLSAWEKVLVARHPERPHFKDYIKELLTEFHELAGDRAFGNDEALIAGIGKFNGISVAVLGQEKGESTEKRIKHNFGMPKPEGYRKAKRIMELANKFNLPILTFVDTPGAHPGIDAEQRGQAEAIAKSIEVMGNISVPIITTIIGEGGSGGALAIAVANKVLMLEHSIYSVVSPEGCASILWKDSQKKEIAANAQKFTAQDLIKFGIIDQIIPEPYGGAQRDKSITIKNVGKVIALELKSLVKKSKKTLLAEKQAKFLSF